jgi:hypothetical protein
MFDLPKYKSKKIVITKEVVLKNRRTKSSIKGYSMILDKFIGRFFK